jgi:hypothetical protein
MHQKTRHWRCVYTKASMKFRVFWDVAPLMLMLTNVSEVRTTSIITGDQGYHPDGRGNTQF